MKLKLAILAVFFSFSAVIAEEACQMFAGGSVYPRETGKSTGHNLQWTRAMSNTNIAGIFYQSFVQNQLLRQFPSRLLISKGPPWLMELFRK